MSSPGKRRNRIFGCTVASIECHDSESHRFEFITDKPQYATPNSPSANSSQKSFQEHMTLFGFEPSSGKKSFAHSGKRKRAGYIPGGNRNTWTHVFVCLSSTTADRIPDAHEKIDLALAGLGEKKVEFDKNGDSSHVHEKLIILLLRR